MARAGSESQLVWLVSPESLDYVRVAISMRGRRIKIGPPVSAAKMRREGNLLAGYAETIEPQLERRYFWLKSYDRPLDPDGTYKSNCPAEAVDPLTLAPNEPGVKNERAWGGPLSKG